MVDFDPDEQRLREESVEIEGLLAALQRHLEPGAWKVVEVVVCRLVRLYGAGLAHAIAHARDATADPEVLDASLAADDLLASLLDVHGLHPYNAS